MEEHIDALSHLLECTRLDPDDWDLVLIGDGSGSGWTNPAGWCCWLLERDEDGTVRYLAPFVGGVNMGSINWAEAMPYWVALRYHYYQMNGRSRDRVRVYIISDSKWVVDTMSGHTRCKIHEDMLSVFAWYMDRGYRLLWRHLDRDVCTLNQAADKLASVGREYLSVVEYPALKSIFHTE